MVLALLLVVAALPWESGLTWMVLSHYPPHMGIRMDLTGSTCVLWDCCILAAN